MHQLYKFCYSLLNLHLWLFLCYKACFQSQPTAHIRNIRNNRAYNLEVFINLTPLLLSGVPKSFFTFFPKLFCLFGFLLLSCRSLSKCPEFTMSKTENKTVKSRTRGDTAEREAVRRGRHVTWVGFWVNALLGVIKV